MTMKIRLPKEDFLPYAPDSPGTVHIHHCKDGPGNNRLYITRKEDGLILAYCHHCGLSGVHNILGYRALQGAKTRKKLRQRVGSSRLSDEEYERHIQQSSDRRGAKRRGPVEKRTIPSVSKGHPSGIEASNFKSWHPHAKRWWLEHGLTIREAEQYGVIYDPERHTLVLPVWGEGKRIGEVEKTFRPDAPKYITSGDTAHQIIPHVGSGPHNELLIVEDLRSAYKCARLIDVVPLLGTNLNDEVLAEIVRARYDQVYVFLDNDNLTVKKLARDIHAQLSPYVKCKVIRVTGADPKEFTLEDLRYVLTNGELPK